MVIILSATQTTVDYTPEIIGIVGTIIGTILGWFLHLISDNAGKISISVNYFYDQKSKNEYAYILNVFIYNSASKQKYIRDMKLEFYGCENHVLFESVPGSGRCSFENIRKKTEEKEIVNLVTFNGCTPYELTFFDLISGDDFQRLSEVHKVYMSYKNKKNKVKRKLVYKRFDLDNVEENENEQFL